MDLLQDPFEIFLKEVFAGCPSGSIWVSGWSFGGCFLSFSSEPEVGSSTEGSCGGILFSGFLGGSLSVKGRVPTESWE